MIHAFCEGVLPRRPGRSLGDLRSPVGILEPADLLRAIAPVRLRYGHECGLVAYLDSELRLLSCHITHVGAECQRMEPYDFLVPLCETRMRDQVDAVLSVRAEARMRCTPVVVDLLVFEGLRPECNARGLYYLDHVVLAPCRTFCSAWISVSGHNKAVKTQVGFAP